MSLGERSGESGAVLVETALVVVLVMALIGGIVEIGALAQSRVSLERLASSAARMAAAGAAGAPSDRVLLAMVGESLTTMPDTTVRRVVVFRAESTSGKPPAACEALSPVGTAATGVYGHCNVYGPGHVSAVVSLAPTPMGCLPPSWEAAWCPESRVRQPRNSDHAGVLIELEHRTPLAGIFTAVDRTVTATAVVRLEPVM